MKVIMVNDSIISLEKVKRVNKNCCDLLNQTFYRIYIHYENGDTEMIECGEYKSGQNYQNEIFQKIFMILKG